MIQYICPNCKNRTVVLEPPSEEASEPPPCPECGYAFQFELLGGYFPARATGFVVCGVDGRVLFLGPEVRALGFDDEALGLPVVEALEPSSPEPFEEVLETRVPRRDLELSLRGGVEVIADLFPADTEVGGLLLGLTPREP